MLSHNLIYKFKFKMLYIYPAKMMPHQIIENTLGHALRSQVAYIQLLVTPLDPSCLCGNAVYQAQCIYFLRMGECKSCQYIGTSSDSETNYRFYAKMAKNEEQLFSQFFHGRISKTEIISCHYFIRQINYMTINKILHDYK